MNFFYLFLFLFNLFYFSQAISYFLWYTVYVLCGMDGWMCMSAVDCRNWIALRGLIKFSVICNHFRIRMLLEQLRHQHCKLKLGTNPLITWVIVKIIKHSIWQDSGHTIACRTKRNLRCDILRRNSEKEYLFLLHHLRGTNQILITLVFCLVFKCRLPIHTPYR